MSTNKQSEAIVISRLFRRSTESIKDIADQIRALPEADRLELARGAARESFRRVRLIRAAAVEWNKIGLYANSLTAVADDVLGELRIQQQKRKTGGGAA